MKYLLLILCLLFFAHPKPSNTGKIDVANKEFASFLKKFKQVDLPIAIKGCKVDASNFNHFEGNDSLFIKEIGGWFPYCTFKVNGRYIAVISLAMADCYLPILTTYDISGNKIDEKEIAIGGCGVGPGFTCEEFMTVRKDYSIYNSDSVTVCAVDSMTNEIKGTEEKYVVYKKGRMLSTGKIELTEETKKFIE